IAAFDTSLRRALWGFYLAFIALCIAVVAYATAVGGSPSEPATFAGLTTILVACLAAHMWYWNAPARELRGRAAAGAPLSRDELTRRYLLRTSYGQLATVGGIGLLALLRAWRDGRPFSGWG